MVGNIFSNFLLEKSLATAAASTRSIYPLSFKPADLKTRWKRTLTCALCSGMAVFLHSDAKRNINE
jgi:hypothetical protein